MWKSVLAGSAVLALSYLVYFDQRRQRDPEFRKRLKKERRLAEKCRAEADAKARAKSRSAMDFGFSEEDDVLPTTDEEKQKYLTKQLILGEQLLAKGPTQYRAAAVCLYRAIRIYPEPLKLLMAFQETCPPAVLEIIMAMMATEVEEARNFTAAQPPQELD